MAKDLIMEPDETPEETDNGPREIDGEQDVTQIPMFEPED